MTPPSHRHGRSRANRLAARVPVPLHLVRRDLFASNVHPFPHPTCCGATPLASLAQPAAASFAPLPVVRVATKRCQLRVLLPEYMREQPSEPARKHLTSLTEWVPLYRPPTAHSF